MTRYAILTLLALTLLTGCRTRREAQPTVDVLACVEADTSNVQHERTDTTREETTSEGGITLTEDMEITYDSTGERPVRIVRRIDIRWLADLQSMISHTSRSVLDSMDSHVDLDIEAELPAVEPECKRGGWLDTVRWIALLTCIYGLVIIIRNWISLWRS